MEGGVGAFTRELALAMSDLGHEIHIITSREARPSQADKRWWRLREPIALDYATLHPRIRRWWWPAMSTIADIAIEQDLELVNVQYQAAAFDMRFPAINFLPWRLRGFCKTAVTFHDLRTPYLFPKAGRLRQWVVHKLAQSADGIIVTNQADQQALIQAGIGQANMCQIPIGSNITTHQVNRADITTVRQKLNLKADDHLLGYFGFLNESKGADALLHALADLDERYHLVFIGGQTGSSDPNNNAAFLTGLKKMIADLGLDERVHWSGFLPDHEVSVYLQTADLITMPYRDGVSLRRGTLMAALAHGRPIISTEPTLTTPELVHGENIWLVGPDDPSALVEAVHVLSQNSAFAKRLGAGAAKTADTFTWDKIANRTADYLATVV